MNKATLTAICLVLCVVLVAAPAMARKGPVKQLDYRAISKVTKIGNTPSDLQATAVQGTTWLGSWTFDAGANCVDEGWVSVDLNTQIGEFWHVDDFAGLGGGDYGLLFPQEGSQSMWCGMRANAANLELCGYATPPGYGNGWDQAFCSTCFSVSGDVNMSYLAGWDSEPGWDGTVVEWSECGDVWNDFGVLYDGFEYDSLATHVIPDSLHTGSVSLRFHFTSDGAWSDGDGYWNTDGAFIVDSLRVWDDSGTLSFEDFEAETVGDQNTVSGDWLTCTPDGYGDFAAIYNGLQVLQEDPCQSVISCVWGFFEGSTSDYACGGHPGVPTVPYENTRGQYLSNEIWSPAMPLTGSGSEYHLLVNWYRDNTVDALVFLVWHVRNVVADCPGPWLDDLSLNYGPDKDWFPDDYNIGNFVDPGADAIQVAVACWDFCGFWCGSEGSGACHSHAPLINDVSVIRIAAQGPQWTVIGWDLFQDSFASDGTTTGTVRIDGSDDILPASNLNIRPADSLTCIVNDPSYGLATDPYTGTGPAVYGYVSIRPAGQPGKSGPGISDDPRFPVVDSTTGPLGYKWYMVRMDSSFNANGTVVPDNFCLDLNDNLFTPGDTVFYFLAAQSADPGGTFTYFHGGYNYLDNLDQVGAALTTPDINVAYANTMELTCLPTVQNSGGDILYVEKGEGRFVQPFFDTAFEQLGILDKVDRYDVRAPSSNLGNGPGSRVTDVFQQIIPMYKKIIWNTEELEQGLIGAGDPTDNSDDFALLYTFIDQSDKNPGLWISGDNVAYEWSTLTDPEAQNLKNVYMNFSVLSNDHTQYGLGIAPLVIGTSGNVFSHITGNDTLVAFGGCPGINDFDVLSTGGGASVVEATYGGNPAYAAILSQTTPNNGGSTAHVMLTGFTYELIRDDRPGANGGVMDRVHHLYDILTFLENTPAVPTDRSPTLDRYTLTQNYPNPFNPTTTIEFTVKEMTPVSVKVYNVAGQLVRTLVNDTRAPGVMHSVTWDGRNDAGQGVASGVYFYRLVAKNFTQTKKMVLLK